jgi:hypothetical protein
VCLWRDTDVGFSSWAVMSGRRILLGLAAVAVGAFLLGDRLEQVVENPESITKWWPVLIVALGIGNLLALTRRPWTLIGPLITIMIGVALLLLTVGGLAGELGPLLLPLAIIVSGLLLALIGTRWDRDLAELDTFRQFVWLRGMWLASQVQSFKSADISVFLGYFELDLRGVELDDAVVNVNAVCGRVDVLVDDNVKVRERRPFVMGRSGVVIRDDEGPEDAALTINVIAFFGTAALRRSGSRAGQANQQPWDGRPG